MTPARVHCATVACLVALLAGCGGWPDERWLDTRSVNVRAILADRPDLAATGGKPVLNAEYTVRWVIDAGERARLCASAQAMNPRTLVLPLDLDGSFRWSCDG